MNTHLQSNNSASKSMMLHSKAKNSLQPKLSINPPGDIYEQEADAMADKVMRMSSNEVAQPITGLIGKSLQRKCAHCEEEDKRKKPVMRKSEVGNSGMFVSASFAATLNASKGGGSPLALETRSFMENAFSADFSGVRVHTGNNAINMSKGINAKAFTHGKNIYFNEGNYNPTSGEGNHLLAHELTHTLQQSFGSEATNTIQRDMNDGHNLQSPRFSGDPVLEACFDDEIYLQYGSTGPAVIKIQQALVDAGYPLKKYHTDGIFGSETQTAVRNYQSGWGVLAVDGIVGPETMAAFDAEFSPIAPNPLPSPMPTIVPEVCSRPLMGTSGPINHAYIDAPPYRYSLIHPFCPIMYDDNEIATRTTAQIWDHSPDPCGQTPSCVPCYPAQGVTNVNDCLRNEFNSYPKRSRYEFTGPNSNTFAGVLARNCCAGMDVKPTALGIVPGWYHEAAEARAGICPSGGPRCSA